MGHAGSSVFAVPSSGPPGVGAGAHNGLAGRASTTSPPTSLCLALACAIASGAAALLIDLSGVEFMSASTLGTIARAREVVRQRSPSLTAPSPSAFVRRMSRLRLH